MAEANPMLGLRGCRLAILYPELPAMQTRAIATAAAALHIAIEMEKELSLIHI